MQTESTARQPARKVLHVFRAMNRGGAEMRTIANAGHWLHIEAPDEFYRAVTKFLAAP